jgi:hypothetical protein
MYLLTSPKTNLAALERIRHLGVNDKTEWRIKHRVLQAMTEREETGRLDGFVQIDDAYLGGERNGGKPGRGSENQQPFLIAVATNEALERPTFAVIEPVRTFDNATVSDWVARRLTPGAEAYTDGLGCFRRIANAGHAHKTLETGGGRAATEIRDVHPCMSPPLRALAVVLVEARKRVAGRVRGGGIRRCGRRATWPAAG